jgi:hypothetical protein
LYSTPPNALMPKAGLAKRFSESFTDDRTGVGLVGEVATFGEERPVLIDVPA